MPPTDGVLPRSQLDMKKKHPPVHQIELRVVQLPELFNSMDPTPFHHRDLDTNAGSSQKTENKAR